MSFDPKTILKDFNDAMGDIRKTIPEEYDAFIREKEMMTKSDQLPEKTKWLLVLIASVSQKCPVCITRAVQHCLQAGWTKAEMLEACMVAVLIGGSSVMTYVTMADKAIREFETM